MESFDTPARTGRQSTHFPRLTANRIAGVSGLVFLILLLVQNVLRAATNPANTASAAQILAFARNEAWAVNLLFVTYVIGFPALFAFAGGLGKLAEDRSPAAALPVRIGQFSVAVIAVLVGLVTVLQVTLVASSGDLTGDPVLVRTLWVVHNGIFTLNLVAVGGALLGLGWAAAISGIVPGWMRALSLAGSLALAASALPIVAEVHGSILLTVGLLGFLCWLLLLASASVGLLRESGETSVMS
jgi:hypothetical protein